jgi:hypothetical protein
MPSSLLTPPRAGPWTILVEAMQVLGQKLGLVRDEVRLSYAERVPRSSPLCDRVS